MIRTFYSDDGVVFAEWWMLPSSWGFSGVGEEMQEGLLWRLTDGLKHFINIRVSASEIRCFKVLF